MTRRARPICDVLEEIKEIGVGRYHSEDIAILCDEALGYAKRMQARLQSNKKDMAMLAMGMRLEK